MGWVDLVKELFSQLICFLLGGVAGAGYLFVTLANEMDCGPRLPWRSRRLFWRYFGDRSFEATAERGEKSRRELYGCLVVAAMADLSGTSRSPYPTSREAYDGLLAEAERRFQLKTKERS